MLTFGNLCYLLTLENDSQLFCQGHFFFLLKHKTIFIIEKLKFAKIKIKKIYFRYV